MSDETDLAVGEMCGEEAGRISRFPLIDSLAHSGVFRHACGLYAPKQIRTSV